MSEAYELKVGHYLRLVGSEVPSGRIGKFYKITSKEPFNYITNMSTVTEFTSIASGATSGFQPIDRLEPDDDPEHLYYVLWGLKDGMNYYMKLPTGVNRIGIDEDRDIGYVNNKRSDYLDPNPEYAFWTLPDIFPAFEADNVTPHALTPEIFFKGVIFEITEVASGSDIHGRLMNYDRGVSGQAFTNVMIGGVK